MLSLYFQRIKKLYATEKSINTFKTKIPPKFFFLDPFTYSEVGIDDVGEFMNVPAAEVQKLLKHIGLKYVRAVGLDDGARKNALFYLTKHITGMLLMNKLVWKHAYDGVTVKAKRDNELTLFDLSTMSGNFTRIKETLKDFIKEKKQLTNVEIIDFVAENCFDTTYANDILKEMKEQDVVSVEYKRNDKTRGFYVADSNWDQDLATIIYRG